MIHAIIGKNNAFDQISIDPSSKTMLPFPIISHDDFSTYYQHSVLINSNGQAFSIGPNTGNQISSYDRKQHDPHIWMEISIKSKKPYSFISSVCGSCYTLYLVFTKSDKLLVLYWQNANFGKRFLINEPKACKIFGGDKTAIAITSESNALIFSESMTLSNYYYHKPFILGLPAIPKEVACLEESIILLINDQTLYEISLTEITKNTPKISKINYRFGQKINHISGTYQHLLVVTENGDVYAQGSNKFGKLGIGKKNVSKSDTFVKLKTFSKRKIVNAFAGYNHSLFIDDMGAVYSCGENKNNCLLLDASNIDLEFASSPVLTAVKRCATFCIAGRENSVVFGSFSKSRGLNVKNKKKKKEKEKSKQNEEIDEPLNGQNDDNDEDDLSNFLNEIKSEFLFLQDDVNKQLEELNNFADFLPGHIRSFEQIMADLSPNDQISSQKFKENTNLNIGVDTPGKSFMLYSSEYVYVLNLPVKIDCILMSFKLINELFLLKLFERYKISPSPNSIEIRAYFDPSNTPFFCARIKFESEEEAKRVVREMNYIKVDGISIHLIRASKNIENIKSNQNELIISNLDHQIESSQLHSSMSKYGEIIDCQIEGQYFYRKNKLRFQSSGIAHIHFLNQQDAMNAMTNLVGTIINGRPVSVYLSGQTENHYYDFLFEKVLHRKIEYPMHDFGPDYSFLFDEKRVTVIVNELPLSFDHSGCLIQKVDEQFLRQFFGHFKIVTNKGSMSIKTKIEDDSIFHSFALVQFKHLESALNAISELNYTKFDGVPIHLILATKENIESLHNKKCHVVVENIDKKIEVYDLYETFSAFGEIIDCRIEGEYFLSSGQIKTDSIMREFMSNGIGHIYFKRPEDALKSVVDLNGAKFNGQKIHIELFDS